MDRKIVIFVILAILLIISIVLFSSGNILFFQYPQKVIYINHNPVTFFCNSDQDCKLEIPARYDACAETYCGDPYLCKFYDASQNGRGSLLRRNEGRNHWRYYLACGALISALIFFRIST